jgi:peptide-methionine (S)-S-oxide reductase
MEMTAGFGGGCHWCTEAVFQPIAGVKAVRQGFIKSDPPQEAWSEAVEVVFDPESVSLRDLLGVYLATHASAAAHRMRGKYRSAVYLLDPRQQRECEAMIRQYASETGTSFVTQSLMHRGFKPSDARFHNYYRADPDKPFCQAYIEPKLAKLRARYGVLLETGNTSS